MTAGAYVAGVLLTATAIAALGWGAFRVRSRWLPHWSGPGARLAEIAVALVVALTASEILGVTGQLRARATVVALTAAGVAMGRFSGSGSPRPAARNYALPQLRPPLVIAAGVVGMTGAVWASRVVHALQGGMTGYDSLFYHLPHAARFLQLGSIVHAHFTSAEPLATYLPANGELVQTLAMLPFHNDFLVVFLNLGWLALALLAAWCIGAPSGVGPAATVAVAITLAAPVMTMTQPGESLVDVTAVALLLTAVALVRTDPHNRAAMGLAALVGGAAIGTKLTVLVPVGVLAVGLVMVAGKGVRIRTTATWALGLLTLGGLWYVRNLVYVGNPVPGLELGIGNLSLPSPAVPGLREWGANVAHYLFDGAAWRTAFRPGLRVALGPAWAAVLGLAAAGTALAMVNGRRRPLLTVLGVVALASAVTYAFTPATAFGERPNVVFFATNLRYLMPALALGLALLPTAGVLAAPRRQAWVMGALAAAFVATQASPDAMARLANSPVPAALRASLTSPRGTVVAVVGAIAAVIAVTLVRDRRVLRPLAVVMPLALLLGGWLLQDHYFERRYTQLSATARWARHVAHTRIAVAGSELQFALYGPDLSNWVQFVGRREPEGGFARVRACPEWRTELERGRYRYVATAPGAPDFTTPPREAAWTRSLPTATEVLRSGGSAVFALRQPVTDAGCPATEMPR